MPQPLSSWPPSRSPLPQGTAWAQAPTIDKSKSYVGTEGTVIVLTFDRELDTSIDGIPYASAFDIRTTLNTKVQIGTFAISDFDNKQLVIRGLTPTIYLGHHAEITYTDPSSGDDTDVLQDAVTKEDVPTFSILGLRNLSEVIPSGPPTIIEAEVDTAGTAIGLAFNKALDETVTGPSFKGSFSVNVGPRALQFTGISFSGHTLNLDGLSPRIHEGDTVRVTYRDPSPADDAVALQDEAGVDANSFTTGTGGVIAIRNGSTYVASTVIKPEFYGSARVGSTLSSPGRYLLENRNIDPVPVFTYTWHHYENNRYGTAISGASTHTYSPTNSDVGKQIGIRISFTEAGVTKAGFSDPVTIHRASLPSTCPAFSAPSGRSEIWNARIHVGSHPRAGDRGSHGYVAGTRNSKLTTQGGSTPVTGFTFGGTTYRVQEILAVATPSPSLEFTIQPPLPPRLRETLHFHACGETYPFRNTFLQHPPLGAHYGWYNAGANWGPRSGSTLDIHLTIAGSPASGSITLSGTPEVGQTLTGEVTGLSDPDGPPGTLDGNPTDYTLNYQWYRYDTDGLSNPRPIAGATGTSYVVTQGDVGKRLRVRATFLDDTGNLETLISPLNQAASAVVPMPQSFVLDATALSVDDDGTTTFTVRLAVDPGQSVSAVVNREDAAHVDVSPDSLAFDGTNWNTPPDRDRERQGLRRLQQPRHDRLPHLVDRPGLRAHRSPRPRHQRRRHQVGPAPRRQRPDGGRPRQGRPARGRLWRRVGHRLRRPHPHPPEPGPDVRLPPHGFRLRRSHHQPQHRRLQHERRPHPPRRPGLPEQRQSPLRPGRVRKRSHHPSHQLRALGGPLAALRRRALRRRAGLSHRARPGSA